MLVQRATGTDLVGFRPGAIAPSARQLDVDHHLVDVVHDDDAVG